MATDDPQQQNVKTAEALTAESAVSALTNSPIPTRSLDQFKSGEVQDRSSSPPFLPFPTIEIPHFLLVPALSRNPSRLSGRLASSPT
jgi:hypothetical protein